jgi:Trk K+ transport system NAD-binding subunit
MIYEKNGVKVIAFEVDHGDVIKPAYGYRIEYGGRVAVISETRATIRISSNTGPAPTSSFMRSPQQRHN